VESAGSATLLAGVKLVSPRFHRFPKRAVLTQLLLPAATIVALDKAQAVAWREPDIERGEIESRNILNDPTLTKMLFAQGTMQVDQCQPFRPLYLQQMTEIVIAVT